MVAPLAGSVDRNIDYYEARGWKYGSLPSRGAWIEIRTSGISWSIRPPSLPSRGAWIEIRPGRTGKIYLSVAPLAGSVDRNRSGQYSGYRWCCRSPRGERG